MAVNYSDALDQIRSGGLLVTSLVVNGKINRCKVEGDKEKRGWYILHEYRLDNGDDVIVGSYGIWQGAENNTQKIDISGATKISAEEKAAIRQRMTEDKKRAEADQKRRANQAARHAEQAWSKLSKTGYCDYLKRKGIKEAVGDVRFSDRGALAIPVQDAVGQIFGLQLILDKTNHAAEIKKNGGKDKQFFPPGMAKKGRFFIIGAFPADVLLVAEGYATAATLHNASGLPVAVVFDANNIGPATDEIRKKYPRTRFLFCADNDNLQTCASCQQPINLPDDENCPSCGKPHKKLNAGVKYARQAAITCNGWVAIPQFTDEAARFAHYQAQKGKLTDFNDLQNVETLASVSAQINAALSQAGWVNGTAARAASSRGGGENNIFLKPVETSVEALERFVYVYGLGSIVFDRQEHVLVEMKELRQLCRSREVVRIWEESPAPAKQIVRADNVGFDPTGNDAEILCNLWSGMPMKPKQGNCDILIELIYHLCSAEQDPQAAATYLIKWLAYPLQNPGAKMRSTIVVHGPQGTGKNILFEMMLPIYGRYARIIDQNAIEDKFNEVFSHKLFVIADEVISRSEAYHVKNKMKSLITGTRIRINPKGKSAYEEANHVNVVFMSNERMPVVLEEDDRRHFVIWTPPPKDKTFYAQFQNINMQELAQAFHYWLLNIDLGDFNQFTPPPMTASKQELISLCKESIVRFYDEWTSGELDGVPNAPAMTEDVYDLYKFWCGKQGVKPTPMNHAIDKLGKRPGAQKLRKRYLSGTKHIQKWFLYPAGCQEMNPGNSESGWLGSCVDEFRAAMGVYKGGNYDG